MTNAAFPVFVRNKGDMDVKKFSSAPELSSYAEPIDVENGEYEGWDNRGYPVALELSDMRSIIVKTRGDIPMLDQALNALAAFAASEGIEFTAFPHPNDLQMVYEKLAEDVRRARRNKPWWKRMLRRV
jgi:hypothetical protein